MVETLRDQYQAAATAPDPTPQGRYPQRPTVTPTRAALDQADLRARAILVTLSLSKWSGKIRDQAVERQIAAQHGARSDAGQYRKDLLADNRAKLKAIEEHDSEIRKRHNRYTLEHSKGVRMLPTGSYFDYVGDLGDMLETRERLVREFLDAYDGLRESARLALNGLYRPEDYPDRDELADAFGASIKYAPMPDPRHVHDWRFSLTEDVVREMEAEIRREQAETLRAAVAEVWQRILDPLRRMVEAAGEPGQLKKARTTWGGNLADVLQTLKALNITDDPRMELARREVADLLANMPDYREINRDETVRADVRDRARNTLATVEANIPPDVAAAFGLS